MTLSDVYKTQEDLVQQALQERPVQLDQLDLKVCLVLRVVLVQ